MQALTRFVVTPYLWLVPLMGLLSTLGAVPVAARPLGTLETAAVMAPLDLSNDAAWEEFQRLLGEAKAIGIDSVSVDVWWGKVEKNGDQQFDWTYYDKIFDTIRNAGLKIVPILSFHKCGGGPGDDCNIPLPGWLWSAFAAEGVTDKDLKYESETGTIQDDAIAPWASANPAVLKQYSQLMEEFAAHFKPVADNFAEINISLGPTGELRYPAYNGSDGWKYPDRGHFQTYSRLAQQSFRDWALAQFGGLEGVSKRWKTPTPLADASQIRVPGGDLPAGSGRRAETFVNRNDHFDTPYGRDFVDWYNQSLVDHGHRLLLVANDALGGDLKAIPLGMKLPGVHWQMMPCSSHPRIAEITAGLVRTSLDPSAPASGHGYAPILDMVAAVKQQAGRNLILHFTAAEMDNDPACGEAGSMAQALVFWISEAARERGIAHKAENALSCVDKPSDDRTWDDIRNVFSYAPYKGFTLLRLTDGPCSKDEPGTRMWEIDKAQYRQFIRDFAPATTWYFRGTPNDWHETAMTPVAGTNRFETCQTFTGKPDPRFKIDRFGDWKESFPAQDYKVSDGSYRILFDPDSRKIAATPAVDCGPLPPPEAWYFRGTPNGWGVTAMEKSGTGRRFTSCQTFSGVPNPRFKICRYQDWRECYPAQDYAASDGIRKITFDADTHNVTLSTNPSCDTKDTWFFRGTPNGWQTTPMEQVGSTDRFRITVDFGRQDQAPRFKIDRFGDWRENYPTQDVTVEDCSRYEIDFDRTTKAIGKRKIGPITDGPCDTLPHPIPTAGQVQVSRFWHNHQPIYWPEWNSNSPQTDRVQYAWDSIVLKNGQRYGTGVGHPDNNLEEIFGSDDRRSAYQGRPRDALARIPPEGGFAMSYSGSLIDDVQSLAANGQLGYAADWWSGNRQARRWQTPSGSPRLDLVGFTYHHALGPVLPKSVLRKEIEIFKQAWQKAWNGATDLSDQSRGFFPTEMAFSIPMIDVLADEGYRWVIVASHHLSRTCPTYLGRFDLPAGKYGIYSSPPNRADLLGPSPTDGWWYGEPNPGNAAWNVAPFAYQLHRAKYVNPETGAEKFIILVPSDDVLSYRYGYADEGIGQIRDHIAPFATDPERPALVMPATDGDNAWGGGFSSWLEATPKLFNDSRNAGYTIAAVQDLVDRKPPPAGETVHIEDGAWIFPESDYGSPYFLKWVEPPLKAGSPTAYPGTIVDLETPGFALKFWSWAPLITGANWCETAEQIWRDEGGAVDAGKIQAPYDWNGTSTNPNLIELAWHLYLAGLDSGFNYYGGLGNDDEVKPSLATRRTIEKLSGFMSPRLAKDHTPPSVLKPQRFPWNPGGYTFGWFNRTPQDSKFLKKMPSEFYVWTHAYDVSGIAAVSLKVRVDRDGRNPLSSNQNETYAGGPEVGAWITVPMIKRVLPRTRDELNAAAANPQIDYFITPPELADYYFAKIDDSAMPDFRGKLLDYYIEASDSRGNVSRSDIEHVFIEDKNTLAEGAAINTLEQHGQVDLTPLTAAQPPRRHSAGSIRPAR
jgi:hypothetical protein